MKFTNGFKRFTKKMSAVLAAALSVSAITVPQVFAAKVNNMPESYTWQNGVYENFENIANVDGLSNSNGFAIQSDKDKTPQFMTVANTDDEHKKAIGLMDVDPNATVKLSPGFQYTLPAKVTSGEVKISFSLKSQQLSEIPIFLLADDSNAQQILDFVNGSKYLLLGTDFNYIKDKWIDVTIVANLDTGLFDITLSGEGLGNGDTDKTKWIQRRNKELNIDSIYGIQFRSWYKNGTGATYTYFDNIKIATKQYIETDFAYVKEDFSGADSLNEIFADSWKWHWADYNIDAEIVNADSSHGNAVNLLNYNAELYRAVKDKNGNSLTSGKYEANFSVYPKDDKTKILVKMNKTILCYFDENNGLGRDQDKAGEVSYEKGKWYDVNVVMDVDNKNGTITVTQGETVVWTKEFTFTDTELNEFRVSNQSASAAFYIDDIIIKDAPTTKPKKVLIDENFDNMTEFSDGWEHSGASTLVDNGEYGKSVKLDAKSASAYIRKSFESASGKIKISFLLNATNYNFYVTVLNKDISGASANQMLMWVDQNRQVHSNSSSASTYGTMDINVNYNMEFEIDTDNKQYQMTLTKVGDVEASVVRTVTSKDIPGYESLSELTGIEIGMWKDDIKPTCLIDNVKVERIVTAPVLSAETVTIKDYNENVIADTAKVTPAISEIVLDFGTQMNEDTLDGAITLAGSDNNAVAFDYALSSDGKTVTIAPTAYLKGGKTYSLSVAKTVANVYDMTMDAAFNMQFETAADFAKAELTTLPKFSDIATGSTLTIGGNFINCTDSSKNLVWVVAYFSGNRLVYADASKETPISAVYGKTTLGQTYTAPDMTGVDRVEVYLWNGMTTMIPFADATPIQ